MDTVSSEQTLTTILPSGLIDSTIDSAQAFPQTTKEDSLPKTNLIITPDSIIKLKNRAIISDIPPILDSTSNDTFLRYKPFRMHDFGVVVRARYAYLMEYNFRPAPHFEIKLGGGTADHTHYNLMGFTTTKITGRYAGFGLSFTSNNYFKPVTSYHHQHGFVVSVFGGMGNLHFSGEKTYSGDYFFDLNTVTTEENIGYQFYEFRLGYELIVDRVVRFDIYPIQLTKATATDKQNLEHQYFPAIGVARNSIFNPGIGIHLIINQVKKK